MKFNIIYLLLVLCMCSCLQNTEPRVIDGDPEPLDPSSAKEYSSVAGVDSDNDGVRDDIERLINNLGKTSNQRRAWKQRAKYQELAILNILNGKQSIAQINYEESLESFECIYEFYEEVPHGLKIGNQLDALMYNTRKRLKIHSKLQQGMAGLSSVSPSNPLERCEFQIVK